VSRVAEVDSTYHEACEAATQRFSAARV
jgi:hypothetical protein